jgi:hypothetical protein
MPEAPNDTEKSPGGHSCASPLKVAPSAPTGNAPLRLAGVYSALEGVLRGRPGGIQGPTFEVPHYSVSIGAV